MTNFVPQKTNISIREILSDEDLISVLDALKEEQDKVLYNREELKKYDLVFCDRRYKLSINYGLKVFLSELGIGSQTMIATAGRHIYGSHLLSKGVDI